MRLFQQTISQTNVKQTPLYKDQGLDVLSGGHDENLSE